MRRLVQLGGRATNVLRKSTSQKLRRCSGDATLQKDLRLPSDDVTIENEKDTSELISVFFYEMYDKKKVEVKGKAGRSLLHLAMNHGVDIDR